MSDENTPTLDVEPASPSKSNVSFADLGLKPEVQQAITEMGFTEPMEVQLATIGPVRSGRDIMVQSRTGSGKTAAFGIPIIDSIVKAEDKFVQAIILLPTRELALQVAAELARIAAKTNVQVVPVYGGAPMGRQVEQLKAGGQIVCGTPGRVLDHLRRGTLKLDRVKCSVLDECDEMLSMGFQEDIESILERTPAERQTLLFSATVPDGIQRLSRRFMRDPEFIKLSADFVGVHEIRHVYYSIPGGQREAELTRIIAFENPERAIIFCNTRDETSRLAEYLRKQGYDAEAISSDLSQSDRERVMTRMRAGGIRFLVATDVAARGIDLENLPAVINYTIPESPEIYIHRTGRTGRAGRHGTAISLIGPAEVGSFYYIKLLYKIRPEERSLPSEPEIRSRREGERVTQLRGQYAEDPGPQWRSLARRVIGASDGERLIAALLAEALEQESPVAARAPAPIERAPRPAPLDDDRPARPSREAAVGYELPRAASSGAAESRDRGDGRERRDVGREARDPAREGRDYARDGRDPAREARDPAREVRDPAREARDPAREVRDPAREARDPAREARDPAREVRDPARDGRDPAREVRDPLREGRDPAREGREQGRFRGRDDRGPRRDGGRGPRGARDPRGRATPGGGPGGGPSRPGSGGRETREFWEVWSEEAGRTVTSTGGEPPSEPAAEALVPLVPIEEVIPMAAHPLRREEGPGQARLYLNLGRKDGASDGDIASLLTAQGLSVGEGDIDVMNTHTYINVDAAEAERLCAALSGKEHSGRTLVCERARPPKRR